MVRKMVFILLLASIMFPAAAVQGAIPASERAALIALYNSTNGDNWKDNSGWKTPPLDTDGFAMPGTESGWYGVTVKNDHVTRLTLLNKNLSGTIPPDIGDLGHLTYVNLSNNNLTGSLPAQLFTLTGLSSLSLSSNSFSGITLDDFLPLTNLSNLEMNSCNISGTIPPAIAGLSKLSYLLLNNNNLSGSLPAELGNMTALSYLWLGSNNLKGSIPPEMGNLTQLSSLNLGSNSLSGTLPVELGNMTGLRSLTLSYNHISGSIPSGIGNLTQLTMLNLANNQFYGSIPTTIKNLVNLQFLHLDDNWLSGNIPPEMGNLTKLKFLYLGSNSLSGAIPPELGNLSDLMIMELDFNYLSGPIPGELGNLDNLTKLDLKSNSLTGTLPTELCDMDKIQTLRLSRNKLTGNIPEQFTTISTLRYFYLGANNFVGALPSSLTNLSGMFYIELSFNGFYTTDPQLESFLEVKSPFWKTSQTIAPADVSGAAASTSSVTLNWTPIEYSTGVGSYRVYSSTTPGGSYSLAAETANKSASSITVTGLNPNTTYYFVIQTKTAAGSNNKNTVYSDYSAEISVTTPAETVPQYKLTVQSSPGAGVSVTVSPADTNGDGSGTTTFTRDYTEGTAVTLTAPAQRSGQSFLKWLVDGASNTNTTVTVTMNSDHTLTAVYEEESIPITYTLTVKSTPDSGASITVTPADTNGDGSGATRFTRDYTEGTEVTLTAPAEHSGNIFSGWYVDGELETGDRTIQVTMDNSHTAKAYYITASRPVLELSRETLNFGCIIGKVSTPAQDLRVTIDGNPVDWSAEADAAWLQLTPSSGTGTTQISVSIAPDGLSAGKYTGSITVSAPDADNSPQSVNVTLNVYESHSTTGPVGEFSTPIDGSTVFSSVPVTGWAVDEIGVESVRIYREGRDQSDLVFIGDAVFVEGARPDVEALYPEYPKNHLAGWGYMLLTYFLPNGGNGTFTLHALATDVEGNEVTLGTRTVTVDNANAVKPFGAIDTPTQGGTVSGGDFTNWGWALTPQPNSIPTDGSTINVYVDGVMLGHAGYNVYREDIAAYFPGYANSDGAAAHYSFDTTAYNDGVHTILWTVTDSAGNADGIGSRYFVIRNSSGNRVQDVSSHRANRHGAWGIEHGAWSMEHGKGLLDAADVSMEPVGIKKGYRKDVKSQMIHPDEKGIVHVQIKELERIELSFVQRSAGGLAPLWMAGYHVVGNEFRPLPAGSFMDMEKGIFYWQPGFAFYGRYTFEFITCGAEGEMTRRRIAVTIVPRFK
jgi:Leucine-rich repeat (LRR) protein